VGTGFKKLTIAFSGWALLLVLASATTRTVEYSQAIALLEHWLIGCVSLLMATTLAYDLRRTYGSYRLLFNVALASIALSIAYLLLGTIAVTGVNPVLMALHLTTAMLILGIALFLTCFAQLGPDRVLLAGPTGLNHRFFFRTTLLTGFGLLLLFATGAFVSGTGTGSACPDWPLCRGEIFPARINLEVAINLLHRFTVVLLVGLVIAIFLQARRQYRDYKPIAGWSAAIGLLFVAQIALGGAYALVDLPGLINVLHLGLSAAIWGSLVVLASVSYMTLDIVLPHTATNAPAKVAPSSVGHRAKTLFKLTKPWILVLLLVTTITAMFIAAAGLPPVSLILYTVLGGALAASGASVLNSYIDSDIDHLMSRTSRRATVTGLVTPRETLVFGITLSVLSFLVFAIFVNTLSAILSTIGILYYVFFYTLYLKRSTIHNIIIGGAAGAIPPLVGWAAVTNNLGLGALYLFAIIFFWTPPHTWALALLVKKDYAKARVPMLPVVVGEKETTYHILLYTIILITLTLLPYSFNMLSAAYLVIAVALGIPFIYLAWKLWRDYNKAVSKRLYKFSQAYLALIFLAMALDRSFF
jgi:protoheme IX farnesyltransferase